MKFVKVHPIGYEARPHSHHPDLFEALRDYLEKRGHAMIDGSRITEADVILFDSAVWESGGIYSPYNWDVLNVVLKKRVPIVFIDTFDHWGTDTYGCTWPGKNDWADARKIQEQDYARFILAASRPGECRILYFMRKMQASGQSYPPWVHPLEYPLFEDYPLVSKEELFARPYDLCMLANVSWPRLTALIDLYRDGRLKVDGKIIHKRLDHAEWVNRHRQAKMFIEADASMGSERPQRLMTVAPMLRVKSDHLIPFPREDMVHQVTVGDYEGNVSKEDIDKILSVVTDPDLLYSIYVNGAEHMRTNYSMEARCNYMIDLIEKFFSET